MEWTCPWISSVLQTLDNGSHAVTCWILLWDVLFHFWQQHYLRKVSSLLKLFSSFILHFWLVLTEAFLFLCVIFVFLSVQMFMTWLVFWSWIGYLTLRNFSWYLIDDSIYFSFGKSDGIVFVFSNLFIEWLIFFSEMVEQVTDLMFWFLSALSK